MLGHELRNPLAPIRTALEIMKLRNSGTTSREEHVIGRQVQWWRTAKTRGRCWEVLRAEGHDVQTAHDGPSALVAIEHFQREYALLDIGLPVMDGYELGRRRRDRIGPDLVPLCPHRLRHGRGPTAQQGIRF